MKLDCVVSRDRSRARQTGRALGRPAREAVSAVSPRPDHPHGWLSRQQQFTVSRALHQEELNVDVVEQDAESRAARTGSRTAGRTAGVWTSPRNCWRSSARAGPARKPVLALPIYLKIAYHLSQEARTGLIRVPPAGVTRRPVLRVPGQRRQDRRPPSQQTGGVLMATSSGSGKTLMATAVARIFEDDHGWETLILSPKNLVPMWDEYAAFWAPRGRVLSLSRAIKVLPGDFKPLSARSDRREPQPSQSRGEALPRHPRLHRGQRKQGHPAFRHPLQQGLSRPFQPAPALSRRGSRHRHRPETLLREIGETEFIRRHQCPSDRSRPSRRARRDDCASHAALPGTPHPNLHSGKLRGDRPATGRKYLTFPDGTRSYFPTALAATVKFKIDARFRTTSTPCCTRAAR